MEIREITKEAWKDYSEKLRTVRSVQEFAKVYHKEYKNILLSRNVGRFKKLATSIGKRIGTSTISQFRVAIGLTGLYILKLDTVPVYVGKSAVCIGKRLRQHKASEKKFNSVEIINIKNTADMDILEIYYINRLMPVYNKESHSGVVPTIQFDNLTEVVKERFEIPVK